MKNFLNKIKNNWQIFFLTFIGALFIPLKFTKAEDAGGGGVLDSIFGLGNIGSFVVGKIIYVISFFISTLTAIILMLIGAFIDWTIKLNANIFDKNINMFMYSGWLTILNFADLLLIFAIIVIAFATILQLQNYGIKKALWKVIVVALVINFSMVIAGVIIDASGILTNFFMEKANPNFGDGNVGNFSSVIAGSMNVSGMQALSQDKQKSISAAASSLTASLITNIASLIFIIAFNVFIIIIMSAFAIMMFFRYFWLSFLLMVSPLAWVFWIFPNTKKYWTMWWDKFLNWVFFAPIVMFFIFITLGSLNTNKDRLSLDSLSGSNAAQALGNALMFPVGQIGGMVMAMFMLYGSIYMANKFSITGAKWAQSTASNAGKFGKDFARKKSLQYGVGWLNKDRKDEEGKSKGSYAQRFAKWGSETKIPLGSTTARGVSALASKAQKISGEAAKNIKDKSTNEKIAMLGQTFVDEPTKIAILEDLYNSDDIGKVPNVQKYITQEYKDKFNKYGKGKAFGNIEKSLFTNVEMKDAYQKAQAAGVGTDVYEKEMANFYKEAGKLSQGIGEKDWRNIQFADILESKEKHGLEKELQDQRRRAFGYALTQNTSGISKAMPKIGPKNMAKFRVALLEGNLSGADYQDYFIQKNLMATSWLQANPTKKIEDYSEGDWVKTDIFKDFEDKVRKQPDKEGLYRAFDKNLAKFNLGFIETEEEQPTQP